MVEPTRSAISSDQITSTASGKDFDIEISGLDEYYRLNKPIEFGVVVRGLGCGETHVQIFKENSELSSIKKDSIISSCVELSNPMLSGDSASLGVYINSNDNKSTVIEQTGNYKVLAWFIQANGTQHTTEKFFSIIQNSPKYQIEHGILAMNIVCRDNFVLLLKTSNEQPACVKPESIAKLVERGWGTYYPIKVYPDDGRITMGSSSHWKQIFKFEIQRQNVDYTELEGFENHRITDDQSLTPFKICVTLIDDDNNRFYPSLIVNQWYPILTEKVEFSKNQPKDCEKMLYSIDD